MNSFDPATEVAMLKQQTKTIRQPRFSRSRLDKFGGELIAMHSAGASVAELQRWLRAQRVKVEYSTVYRWVKKHGQL